MYSKYHGCGNDFIIGVWKENVDYSKEALKYCNRYTGVGADGMILAKKLEKEYEMVFYNADGSRAPMCGNGIRCLARFLYDKKLVCDKEYDIETMSGPMHICVESFDPYYVTINLGKPDYSTKRLDIISDEETFLDKDVFVNGKTFNVSCYYMATHHLVTSVDDLDLITEKDGKELCFYKQFSKQINVNFLKQIDRENALVKTYERGVGFTKACGTGGASCFHYLKQKGLIENSLTVHLEYGVLKYFEKDGDIFMTGPAVRILEDFVI